MSKTTKTCLLACALALCLGGAGAASAGGGMSKDAYRAAQKRIDLQHKAAKKACDRLQGNAEDICQAEADGKAAAAQAALAARYNPNPDTERDAKEAQAEAEYDIAKERCDDARKGKARDACLAKAKNALEAAIRLAKIERVETLAELKDKREEPKPQAQSLNAQYNARKNYCQMKGPERDECLADAKRRFNKS
jgi:hypothetical protein